MRIDELRQERHEEQHHLGVEQVNAEPRGKALPKGGSLLGRLGDPQAAAMHDRLPGQPQQIDGAGNLEGEEQRRRRDDQHRDAERHQRRVDHDAGHRPEHRREAMRPAIVDGPAHLQRHVRPRGDHQHERRQRDGEDDRQVGDEGGHGFRSN